MHYSTTYREQVTLKDGSEVEIRAIQKSDKAALASAFAHLSEKTRYRRFHAAKRGLTEQEIRFFTECDGVNHFALVAIADDGPEDASGGVGVARFVRTPEDPLAAEVAIVVIDEWQRRGIGQHLLKRVVAAAGERGIRKIVAVTQADNEQIRGLLNQVSDDLKVSNADGLTTVSYPVPEALDASALDVLYALLRLTALGALLIPMRLSEGPLRSVLKANPPEDENDPDGSKPRRGEAPPKPKS